MSPLQVGHSLIIMRNVIKQTTKMRVYKCYNRRVDPKQDHIQPTPQQHLGINLRQTEILEGFLDAASISTARTGADADQATICKECWLTR